MKGKKILVIEPDFESLKSLSRFLLDAKFDVITAFDGEEGLKKAKKENLDLIILEPRLPKMSGFDLCSIITKDFERKIPVVILTEFFQDFKADILKSFGAAAYLNKPFEKEKLFYTLLDLLKEGKVEESKDTRITSSVFKSLTEKHQEESESKTKRIGDRGGNGDGTNGNGSNGNGQNGNGSHGHDRQLEMLLSSYTFEASPSLLSILAQDDNGSQKKNGQVIGKTVDVEEMLEDVLSEFGLTYKKKTSLQEDIRALNDLIASC